MRLTTNRLFAEMGLGGRLMTAGVCLILAIVTREVRD